MAKTNVRVGDFSKALDKYLNDYAEDIEDDVVELTDKVTKEAKDELVRISPRGKGGRNTPYYKGWTVKLGRKGKSKYEKVIWNRTNYQLTHLLEFGHAKSRGTGRVAAQPHIRQVEEKYSKEFVELLERKIGGTK